MNVSIVLYELLYYKEFDVNDSIQYKYYFFSYCNFISDFQFSKFNLQQMLHCVCVDGEKKFGKYLGYNKRHKCLGYGIKGGFKNVM